MKAKNNGDSDTWLQIIFGVLAIFAIKSIFEHDNSKIISKKGSKILADKDKMAELRGKIDALEDGNSQQEVYIN